MTNNRLGHFPPWLHKKAFRLKNAFNTKKLLQHLQIYSVCEKAKCPNRQECYSNQTATFLALGKECTRNCGFCDIDFSKTPKPPDPNEISNIAIAIKKLKLKHAVITMVTRDDLPDQGSSHIASIIKEIKKTSPLVTIEVLVSDFSNNFSFLDIILNEKPHIFNHNIETVKSLSSKIRHKAKYDTSLSVLNYSSSINPPPIVKSGLMVGLGEEEEEVLKTIKDLHDNGCSIITIGQYLQPSKNKLPVKQYISPKQFKKYEEYGYSLGVQCMFCGPFVRSSYHAKKYSKFIGSK